MTLSNTNNTTRIGQTEHMEVEAEATTVAEISVATTTFEETREQYFSRRDAMSATSQAAGLLSIDGGVRERTNRSWWRSIFLLSLHKRKNCQCGNTVGFTQTRFKYFFSPPPTLIININWGNCSSRLPDDNATLRIKKSCVVDKIDLWNFFSRYFDAFGGQKSNRHDHVTHRLRGPTLGNLERLSATSVGAIVLIT